MFEPKTLPNYECHSDISALRKSYESNSIRLGIAEIITLWWCSTCVSCALNIVS